MCLRCRIVSLSRDFGLQTVLHATWATPLVSDGCVPFQKKSRMMLSIWCRTPSGIRNIAIKYMGMVASTVCNSTKQPAEPASPQGGPQSLPLLAASREREVFPPPEEPRGSGWGARRQVWPALQRPELIPPRTSRPRQPRTSACLAAGPRSLRICPTWWRRGAPRLSIRSRRMWCRLRTVAMECPPVGSWSVISAR